MLGALQNHISTKTSNYVPMHCAYDLTPPLDPLPRKKDERKPAYANRALKAVEKFLLCTGQNIN
jgi:folate-dependent tRNA-U54 methylase TrmFO/GidA